VEHKDATVEERKILEVNAGIYIFRRADLEYSLGQLTNENSQGEFYLTDTIAIINKYEGKVLVMEADDPKSCRGINSRRDLLECQEIMKKRINYRLMDEGVTLYSLENIYVEADCQIGEDTILYPGTIIRGGSQIGSNCRIGPDSLISATRVGNGSAIHYSVVEEADIPPEVAIGPFAHVKG
jgi:bifunctional UDP-N-acetylglucosamine pyrophosphorylase/glucosamine-1-phosphate N-acetyltransferase